MTVAYETELKNIREEAQKAEKLKVQLETKKDEALKRKAELEAQCQAEGVNPGELAEELKKLDKKIEKSISELKAKLPQVDSDSEPF